MEERTTFKHIDGSTSINDTIEDGYKLCDHCTTEYNCTNKKECGVLASIVYTPSDMQGELIKSINQQNEALKRQVEISKKIAINDEKKEVLYSKLLKNEKRANNRLLFICLIQSAVFAYFILTN